MVGNVLFANSYEHLEDQADPLNVDSYESLLQHLLRDRSRVLPGKFERDRELIDFLPRIGHEASCKTEFFRMNEGFKSNMKTLLREHYIGEFNRRFQVASAQPGSAFMPCRAKNLERIFSLQFGRTVNRDNTVSFQNLTLQIEPVRVAGHAGGLHRDRAPTPGWNLESQLWAALPRSLRRARRSDLQPETGDRQGRGKVQKRTFPPRLEIPQSARDSHFPTASAAAGD
jgi:hypothetical protein